MKRGEIVMKNVTFRDRSYLRYSTIQFNESKQKIMSTMRELLQTKLDLFEKTIQIAYMKMLDYALKKHFDQIQLPIDIEDMFFEYNQTIKNGIPILNKLIDQLNHKQVSEETMQSMNEIFNHQVKMTKRITEKELSIERLEIVYNHLLNVPYYLESDLDIDSLPNQNVKNIKFKDEPIREISTYDLTKNRNFYETGA